MKNIATYGLTHLAVAVTDLERTLKFYQNIFGMEVMYHEAQMIQLTTPGSHDVLVFEKIAGPTGQSGGIAHFGFRLRTPGDIDEMLERIKASGADIVDQGEFVPGSPYVFFKDPDGYIIEVWFEADVG